MGRGTAQTISPLQQAEFLHTDSPHPGEGERFVSRLPTKWRNEGAGNPPLLEDQALLAVVMLIMFATTGWSNHHPCWRCNNFAGELFFSFDPIFDIIPGRTIALDKQLVSSV